MEKERPYKRTGGEVMRDFPDIGETESKREKALKELLRCLGKEDYQKLKERQWEEEGSKPRYIFSIVSKDVLGKVHRFDSRIPLIVYLSPILEVLELNHIIVVAAHELAHVFLGHCSFEEYNQKEEIMAWKQVCEWGFEKEIEAYFEFRKEKQALELILNSSAYPRPKGGEPTQP